MGLGSRTRTYYGTQIQNILEVGATNKAIKKELRLAPIKGGIGNYNKLRFNARRGYRKRFTPTYLKRKKALPTTEGIFTQLNSAKVVQYLKTNVNTNINSLVAVYSKKLSATEIAESYMVTNNLFRDGLYYYNNQHYGSISATINYPSTGYPWAYNNATKSYAPPHYTYDPGILTVTLTGDLQVRVYIELSSEFYTVNQATQTATERYKVIEGDVEVTKYRDFTYTYTDNGSSFIVVLTEVGNTSNTLTRSYTYNSVTFTVQTAYEYDTVYDVVVVGLGDSLQIQDSYTVVATIDEDNEELLVTKNVELTPIIPIKVNGVMQTETVPKTKADIRNELNDPDTNTKQQNLSTNRAGLLGLMSDLLNKLNDTDTDTKQQLLHGRGELLENLGVNEASLLESLSDKQIYDSHIFYGIRADAEVTIEDTDTAIEVKNKKKQNEAIAKLLYDMFDKTSGGTETDKVSISIKGLNITYTYNIDVMYTEDATITTQYSKDITTWGQQVVSYRGRMVDGSSYRIQIGTAPAEGAMVVGSDGDIGGAMFERPVYARGGVALQLKKRVSGNVFKVLQIKHLTMKHTFGETTYTSGLLDKTDYFRLLIPMDVLNKINFTEWSIIHEQSVGLLIQTKVTVKVKWYQSSIFKVITFAIATYFGPVGIVLWFVVQTGLLNKVFDALGIKSHALRAVIMIVISIAIGGGYGSFGTDVFANFLLTLKIISDVFSVLGGVEADKAAKIKKEAEAFEEEKETKQKEIDEPYQEMIESQADFKYMVEHLYHDVGLEYVYSMPNNYQITHYLDFPNWYLMPLDIGWAMETTADPMRPVLESMVSKADDNKLKDIQFYT
jgi:hypothetical protein